MGSPELFLAADLGASSGRVLAGRLEGGRLQAAELHRFPTAFSSGGRYLRWDLDAIEAHVLKGFAEGAGLGRVASAGVDSWGVDHVLVDEAMERVGEAVCYRDPRTARMVEAVTARVPAAEVYRRTGIQFQPFNTLYQLAATAALEPGWMARARRMLMIPDYLHHRLCGVAAHERTNASTTQMLGLDGEWDAQLAQAAGAGGLELPRPVEAGSVLGVALRGAPGARVVAPASHDTASAVVATPLASPDEAFLSSGTWSLLGFESPRPFADESARSLNVTNEAGYAGSFRVLKNVMGLWLLQRLAAELGCAERDLALAADGAPAWRSLVDPDDPLFLNPPSMREALALRCRQTGQPVPGSPAELARCAMESLALSYGRALEGLSRLRGRAFTRIRAVGGGSQNAFLAQLCADACAVPVSAGPVEASALGNLCVQMLAMGRLGSLAEAREMVGRMPGGAAYEPRQGVPGSVWSRFRLLQAAADRR